MSTCSCNGNVSCRCNSCCNIVRSESLSVDSVGNTVTINTGLAALNNNHQVCLVINQCIPDEVSDTYRVLINAAGGNYSLVDMRGHYIYGDQLLARSVIPMRFASDTALFIYNGCRKLRKAASCR